MPATASASQPKVSRQTQARLRALVGGVLVLGLTSTVVLVGLGQKKEPALADANTGLTQIPSAQQRLICPGQPQLVAGVDKNTDAEFKPGSSKEKTRAEAVAVTDLAARLPWVRQHSQLSQDSAATSLTPKVSEELQQGPAQVIGADGQSIRKAKTFPLAGSAKKPQLLSVAPLGSSPGLVHSLRSYHAPDGDLRGLAVGECLAARFEHWLTGLTTEVGATAVLNLANPSATPAVISLDFFGSRGQVNAPGSRGIVLAPGQQRSFLVAGFAPDEPQVGVRVRSSGGAVAAWATQTFLYGLQPGGVDYVPASETPSRSQTITGYYAPDPKKNAPASADAQRQNSAPALLVTSASATDTTVRVDAFRGNSPVALPGGGTFTVPARGTASFSLAKLPAGHYTFRLSSDQLITATARSRAGAKNTDISYTPSAQALSGTMALALPEGTNNTLVFGAGEKPAQLTIRPVLKSGALGKAKKITVQPGSSYSLPVKSLAAKTAVTGALITTEAEEVYGNVVVLGAADEFSSYPIRPTGRRTTAVAVTLSE